MAVAALDGTVLALKSEIRGFVTEGFKVQLNDVRSPSFVIRVTVFALGSFHFEIAAMKPFLPFEVNTHRLVARQALLILPALLE